MQAHFGVRFAPGELEAIATVRALVDLLRRKFDEE
jgi:acyl carrier protein